MISRPTLARIAIFVLAAAAVTAAPHAFLRHGTVLASDTSVDVPVQSCSDLQSQFDHRSSVMDSEEITITKSEAPTLHVHAGSNGGGVYVRGWDKEAYSVTLCKAVEEGPGGHSVLSDMHLDYHGGDLRVSTPRSGARWTAHLLIRAPKEAVLDIQMQKGPIILYHVDGNLKVRGENGPVSVIRCTGELEIASFNGPVTLDENAGKQFVRVENAPLRVRLSGNSWNGPGLEASTRNGALTLELPPGYRSGVLLESEGQGIFRCDGAVCAEGRKTSDNDHRRVEFGSGPTLVRVSTVNGTVSID